MVELGSILNCVRGMEYKGINIRYITGVCNEVRLNMEDCMEVLRRFEYDRVGYINDSYDMLNLLGDSGSINKAIYKTFQEYKIVYNLEDNYINIESMITLCNYYKMSKFGEFLLFVKNEIDKFGSYLGRNKFVSLNKRSVTEKNLSDTLSIDAITTYADLNGITPEEVYVEVCDIISGIIFDSTMEDVRARYGLYYEDHLCDSLDQTTFDRITFSCTAISYLLKHSNVSYKGMEIFVDMALRVFDEDYKPSVTHGGYKRKNKTDDDAYLTPIKKNKENEELEDFKRYM